MKTVEYWDKKRDEVLRAIELFDRHTSVRCQRSPPRKDGRCHATWRIQYEAWLITSKNARAFAKRREKLARRLAYIEARVRATTPTFWSKL